MKQQLSSLVFASALVASSTHAQQVTNFPNGTSHAVGLEGGLDSAMIARGSYYQKLPAFVPDATLSARLTLPFADPDVGDFAVDAGLGATVLGGERWKVHLDLGPVLRSTENENFTATGVGVRSLVFAGYRGDLFGLGLELGYEQIFATHVEHTDFYRRQYYPDAKDGWYALTGGTWQLGLRGGGRIGPVEIQAGGGLVLTQQGNPTSAPFYGTLGASYAF